MMPPVDRRPADSLLRDACKAVLDADARPVRPGGRTSSAATAAPPRWIAAAAGMWCVLAWLVVAPPQFARYPTSGDFMAPGNVRGASLRFGAWLAANRVERFRADRHRLPESLAEVAIEDRALRFQRFPGDSWMIRAIEGGTLLTLTSSMARDSFLGESLEQLRGGGR